MMRTHPRGILSPIALDISLHTVAAAQLLWTREAWEPVATVCVGRRRNSPDLSDDEAHRLSAILDRNGFVGSAASITLPASRVVTASISAPRGTPHGALMAMASSEASRAALVPPSQLEVAMWPIPTPARGKDEVHAMIVACAEREACAVVAAMERAALRVDYLEPRPLSLARACAPLFHAPDTINAIMDLGEDCVSVTLIVDGAAVYTRDVPSLGYSRVSLRLRQLGRGTRDSLVEAHPHLTLDEPPPMLPRLRRLRGILEKYADDLSKELAAAVTFARHQYPRATPGTAVLTGLGASIAGIGATIARNAQVPTERALPASVLASWDSSDRAGSGSGMMAAVGLAMSIGEAA